MPVVMVAMEQPDYDKWLKSKLDAAKQGSSLADETHDQLVKNGGEIYAKNCATCHMPDGAGIPGAFPALKGSAVVNGDIKAQANVVLNGRNAMPAFGKQLKAAELAEVITYTRNALGNSKGDEIQPKDINALLGGSAAGVAEAKPSKENPKTEPATQPQAADKVAASQDQPKQANKPKPVANQDEEVDNVQFASDKFYPQQRVTDKPSPATAITAIKAESKSAQGQSTLADLVKKGEGVYQEKCQSCHQPGGVGMPPVFPALKGSAVVTGKIDDQVDIMLKGKGMMPAFGGNLNAVDFASVLAFTRNKLNATGDFKQPSEIEALQAGNK